MVCIHVVLCMGILIHCLRRPTFYIYREPLCKYTMLALINVHPALTRESKTLNKSLTSLNMNIGAETTSKDKSVKDAPIHRPTSPLSILLYKSVYIAPFIQNRYSNIHLLYPLYGTTYIFSTIDTVVIVQPCSDIGMFMWLYHLNTFRWYNQRGIVHTILFMYSSLHIVVSIQ